MGTRYFLILDCPYCGKTNEDIYYAPTCDFLTHRCDYCEGEFDIEAQFCEEEREEMEKEREEHSAMMRKMFAYGTGELCKRANDA